MKRVFILFLVIATAQFAPRFAYGQSIEQFIAAHKIQPIRDIGAYDMNAFENYDERMTQAQGDGYIFFSLKFDSIGQCFVSQMQVHILRPGVKNPQTKKVECPIDIVTPDVVVYRTTGLPVTDFSLFINRKTVANGDVISYIEPIRVKVIERWTFGRDISRTPRFERIVML